MTSEIELSEGDLTFRWWNHMIVFLHAETYFHHYEIGLMPANSLDFSRWVDQLLAEEFQGDVQEAHVV